MFNQCLKDYSLWSRNVPNCWLIALEFLHLKFFDFLFSFWLFVVLHRVIAYVSHAMNPHELGYCITRKELPAIYYFTLHFKHYLYGKRFRVRTNHKAITFIVNIKKLISPQFQTWINHLSSLDMKLEYRKGELQIKGAMQIHH